MIILSGFINLHKNKVATFEGRKAEAIIGKGPEGDFWIAVMFHFLIDQSEGSE